MVKSALQRETLSPDDQAWLAEETFRLLPALKLVRRRAWARRLIRELLWFWTADAVNARGVIQRDAIKYDPLHLRHTDAALRAWESGDTSKLEHEHAAELAELLDILETVEFASASDVLEFLQKMNIAVLVVDTEHRELAKVEWPKNWRERNPLARYRDITVNEPLGAR